MLAIHIHNAHGAEPDGGEAGVPRALQAVPTCCVIAGSGGIYPRDLVTCSGCGVATTKIDLIDQRIKSIYPGAFSYLPNLQVLWLAYNELTSVPARIFSNLSSSLLELRLEHNLLTSQPSSLPVGTFSNLANLKELTLNHNLLTSLPADVFAGTHKLQVIQLDDNQLTLLPAGIFSGLANLEYLTLTGNQLTMLLANTFTGLASLRYLTLSDNKLTPLPAGTFTGLTTRLYLAGGTCGNAFPTSCVACPGEASTLDASCFASGTAAITTNGAGTAPSGDADSLTATYRRNAVIGGVIGGAVGLALIAALAWAVTRGLVTQPQEATKAAPVDPPGLAVRDLTVVVGQAQAPGAPTQPELEEANSESTK